MIQQQQLFFYYYLLSQTTHLFSSAGFAWDKNTRRTTEVSVAFTKAVPPGIESYILMAIHKNLFHGRTMGASTPEEYSGQINLYNKYADKVMAWRHSSRKEIYERADRSYQRSFESWGDAAGADEEEAASAPVPHQW
jgi:hypothetical protein